MSARPVRWSLSFACVTTWLAAMSCNAIVDFDGYTFTRAPCTQTSDCKTPTNSCLRAECINGGCSEVIAVHKSCSTSDQSVCDAKGQCVGCLENADCPSGVCVGNVCLCHDGLKNGDESGIDCGGSCAACNAGTTCTTNNDCIGGTCTTGVCETCGTTEWAQWTPGNGQWAIRNTTVRDERTGLTWTREPAPNKQTWANAVVHCEKLSLDEGTWRLPTRIELGSIVDYTKTTPPALDPKAFPKVPSSGFWTATETAANAAQAWFVSFGSGNIDITDKMQALSVLCVRR